MIWGLTFTIILTGCFYNSDDESPEVIAAINNFLVTSDKPRLSPSGKYILEINYVEVEGVKSFHFCIVNSKNSAEIYVSDDYYRIRNNHYLLWGENDSVWVYSGDLETFYWEESDDGKWIKNTYYLKDKEEVVRVPQALKDLRPRYFGVESKKD